MEPIQISINHLKKLRHSNGLQSAALSVKTGYNLTWIRDTIYQVLGYEAAGDKKSVVKTCRALLDLLLKHEWKVDHCLRERPKHHYQYIHPRYCPVKMCEIWEEWGNKQNDAIGALLFKIGQLENNNIKILRNNKDKNILQKLVNYLEAIEYWHDKDSGMWEEDEEIHASSIGACVAGLKQISKIIEVPQKLIDQGELALKKLLPRESARKEVDLSLLSLIYPYNVVDKKTALEILANVEEQLVKRRGVIRYKGDHYYNECGEAEWTMGLPWLATIFKKLNNPRKYAYYMRKSLSVMNEKGELPELYYAYSSRHNENSPLGWAQALYLVAASD